MELERKEQEEREKRYREREQQIEEHRHGDSRCLFKSCILGFFFSLFFLTVFVSFVQEENARRRGGQRQVTTSALDCKSVYALRTHLSSSLLSPCQINAILLFR